VVICKITTDKTHRAVGHSAIAELLVLTDIAKHIYVKLRVNSVRLYFLLRSYNFCLLYLFAGGLVLRKMV